MSVRQSVVMTGNVKCTDDRCVCSVSQSSTGVGSWRLNISAASGGVCHLKNTSGDNRRIVIALQQLSLFFCAHVGDVVEIDAPTSNLLQDVIRAGSSFWAARSGTGAVVGAGFAPSGRTRGTASRTRTRGTSTASRGSKSIRQINGLGPKSEAALNAHGVKSVTQLKGKSAAKLTEFLEAEGVDHRSLDPADWIRQAKRM